MTLQSLPKLINALQRLPRLAPDELAELIRRLPGGSSNPQGVARHLYDRGWLTAEQFALLIPPPEVTELARLRETILIGSGEDDQQPPDINLTDAGWSLPVDSDGEVEERFTEEEEAEADVPSLSEVVALSASSWPATPRRFLFRIGAASLIVGLLFGAWSVSKGLSLRTSDPHAQELLPEQSSKIAPHPANPRPPDEQTTAPQSRSNAGRKTKVQSPPAAKESPPLPRVPEPPSFCKLGNRIVLGGNDQPRPFGLQRAVAFRDSLLLASGTRAGRVNLWRADSASPIRSWKAHADAVNSLAFHPNGQLLATASDDHSVKMWVVETGQEVRTWNGHREPVLSVTFSPNGRWTASGSADGKVRAWRTASGAIGLTCAAPRRLDEPTSSAVRCVAFSPDSSLLAYSTDKGQVQLLDIQTRQPRWTLAGQEDIEAVAFRPDGRFLAAAAGGTVLVLDTADGREQQRMQDPANQAVSSLTFSRDGRVLATASGEGMVRLWDSCTGQLLDSEFAGAPGHAPRVGISSDGRWLATVQGRRMVNLFQLVSP
jgi:WD40 repeat protein